MVWSEGALERDYIRLMEYDPDVTSYHEQPVIVTYRYWANGVVCLEEDENATQAKEIPLGSRRTRYYPDFYVERTSRPPLLIEVKNERFLDTPEVLRKLAAGHLLAKAKGWEFRVVTETIRQGCLLDNIRILQRYSRVQVPIEATLRVTEILAQAPWPVSVRQLAEILAGPNGDRRTNEAYVYALADRGDVALDPVAQSIGPHSPVYAPGGVRVGFGLATTGRTVLV